MSEKKKFTVYVGSVALCVGAAVLLHYVSFTNPYLQSICHLLRPFIYIGLYLVWAISFQKRIIQKELRCCLIMIAAMMVFICKITELFIQLSYTIFMNFIIIFFWKHTTLHQLRLKIFQDRFFIYTRQM